MPVGRDDNTRAISAAAGLKNGQKASGIANAFS
jgi:hypothetical protein